ncbi:class III extradiol ring-cleavage dioxygenase [Paenibacillus filicis]|uniref:Class III extradiol ring-cleavage dioxygenase n=1 Tax=Paenibacillus gyeongsangnamensis TaxID=3388067 RepID=A0ABT4QH22_9BACL|nr:class III extradiol ring-cleavage dioxygenase [Paenibacillus filicis]MCZ8516181.1 class III extradiol ring-cleavage dioxygenase [Paenibacillus filicis]
MLPSLFVAHGAPTLVQEKNKYTELLRVLAERLPRPKAVIVFSAHWEAPVQRIGSAVKYETLHDFFGYPEALYREVYPARGEIALALQAQELLQDAGIASVSDDARGLDHGAWSVLKLMYPQADIPVVTMSVNPRLVPEEQYRIGRALAPLRERGVLILGSGGTVNNPQRLEWNSRGARDWALAFDEWLAEQIETWNLEALFHYEALAPHASDAVPTAEHFAPLLIAMGAAHRGKKARLLHRQYQLGTLSLSCWMLG